MTAGIVADGRPLGELVRRFSKRTSMHMHEARSAPGESPALADVDAFVAWEALQGARHEYRDGVVSLLPGGTNRHAELAALIIGELYLGLRGTAYHLFSPDALVVMDRSARYPDVSVVRDARDTGDLGRVGLRRPILLVEVLSPSTEAEDRGPKRVEYLAIETLEEYVLVDSRRRAVTAFRRTSAGWIEDGPVERGLFRFASVDVTMDLDAIYEKVDVPLAGDDGTRAS